MPSSTRRVLQALAAIALVAGLVAAAFRLESAQEMEAPATRNAPDPDPPPAASGAAPRAAAPPPRLAEEPDLPLARLLTLSDEGRPDSLDLGPRREAADAGAGAGPSPVYLRHRSESHGPTTREQALDQTELGLRVPVDSSVQLQAGVRVDSREDAGTGERRSEASPTVGVEVRF